jgi:hypothetical protein
MPETKKRIVIASVLKPVSDPRMTEKIATTLSHDDTLDVHVIGYPAKYFSNEKITFHSFAPFARISLRRLVTPFNILRKIRSLKPSVVIIATHELLWMSLLAKLIHGTKVVYDIQENYYLNIIHTRAFNPTLKLPIALYVRLKEKLATLWVDHFILAEAVYVRQLNFTSGRHTVLENKVIEPPLRSVPNQNTFELLFSGTLAAATGVFEAITLTERLREIDSRITLRIIGFAPLKKELDRIRQAIMGSTGITLVGGDRHVDHKEIVQAISSAAAGIIAYERNAATEGRVPTKLFEYIGHGLPIIFSHPDPSWSELAGTANHPYTIIDMRSSNLSPILALLSESGHRGTSPGWIYWKSEEIKLQTLISAL